MPGKRMVVMMARESVEPPRPKPGPIANRNPSFRAVYSFFEAVPLRANEGPASAEPSGPGAIAVPRPVPEAPA